jgi:hypothetical protein
MMPIVRYAFRSLLVERACGTQQRSPRGVGPSLIWP